MVQNKINYADHSHTAPEFITGRANADLPFMGHEIGIAKNYLKLRNMIGKEGDKMASTIEFIDYVCEQINGIGDIRFRKMFGEYMVYVNQKPILLICDNTVFVKMLDCIREKMKAAEIGFPYDGAKEHYILDIDNAEFSKEIIALMEPFISIPKPKKKK